MFYEHFNRLKTEQIVLDDKLKELKVPSYKLAHFVNNDREFVEIVGERLKATYKISIKLVRPDIELLNRSSQSIQTDIQRSFIPESLEEDELKSLLSRIALADPRRPGFHCKEKRKGRPPLANLKNPHCALIPAVSSNSSLS